MHGYKLLIIWYFFDIINNKENYGRTTCITKKLQNDIYYQISCIIGYNLKYKK